MSTIANASEILSKRQMLWAAQRRWANDETSEYIDRVGADRAYRPLDRGDMPPDGRDAGAGGGEAESDNEQ